MNLLLLRFQLLVQLPSYATNPFGNVFLSPRECIKLKPSTNPATAISCAIFDPTCQQQSSNIQASLDRLVWLTYTSIQLTLGDQQFHAKEQFCCNWQLFQPQQEFASSISNWGLALLCKFNLSKIPLPLCNANSSFQ